MGVMMVAFHGSETAFQIAQGVVLGELAEVED